MEAHIHWELKETKVKQDYLESLLYLMELNFVTVKRVKRATEAKRERKEMLVLLVFQDCRADQDSWVQKVNLLLALLDLWALQDSLVLKGSDDLVLEAPPAHLDQRDLDLRLPTDQLLLFLAHLVPPVHPDLQDILTRLQPTRASMP